MIQPSSLNNKARYLTDFKAPSLEDDKMFLASLPPTEVPQVILQSLNGYQLLPRASPNKPYMVLDVDKVVRLGRSNTENHANFVVVAMTQVISRNHLEFSQFNGDFLIKDVGSNSGTWLNG